MEIMLEPIFFEIPIYRCNRKQHSEQLIRKTDKIVAPYKDIDEETYRLIKQHISYGWKYNEIIGYLNLFILGNQLRIEQWCIDKQRVNGGIIKKKFKYKGDVSQAQIYYDMTSQEICALIKEELDSLKRNEFKRYHVELSTFNLIAPYVDWKELATKLNYHEYPEIRRAYFNGLK